MCVIYKEAGLPVAFVAERLRGQMLNHIIAEVAAAIRPGHACRRRDFRLRCAG